MAKIIRVHGNPLTLAIPLQTKTITQDGTVTEDYVVPADAQVTVTFKGAYKSFEMNPVSVDGNLVTVTDNGRLPVGVYAVEVRVRQADGQPMRSKYCNIVDIRDCNDGVTEEYIDFIEGSVTLDNQVFWFAKGDKGDPFTFADFAQEQIELLQKPAQDKANEVTELQEQWTEAETRRSQAETLRQQAEQGRERAEGTRQTTFLQNEQQRQTTFDTNEQARQEAERQREVAEGGRKNAEEQRNTSEEHRQTNEQARNDTEVLREQNESKRQQDTQTAINNAEQATSEAENVNARLSSDGGVVILTITNRQGYQTSKEVGFRIAKTYPNVAAMNADLANVEEGRFVMIAGSTEDVDTGKLYVRGASAFTFITDLSGAQGIKGDTGNGIASVTLNADYTLTIVFTDGTSTTTTSIRGEKGDPFTYDDFTPEQITELQRPATEKAEEVEAAEKLRKQAETARSNAEEARQGNETIREKNEQTRQSNTSTAISNAEAATSSANNAASNAEEKAVLANTKAQLADQKATLADAAAQNANTKATLADQKATLANAAAQNANTAAEKIQTASFAVDAEMNLILLKSEQSTLNLEVTDGNLYEIKEQ